MSPPPWRTSATPTSSPRTGTVVLRFKARVGDRELEGIDFLELDEQGLVSELTVFMRPMSALTAFNEQMAARLGVECRDRTRVLTISLGECPSG